MEDSKLQKDNRSGIDILNCVWLSYLWYMHRISLKFESEHDYSCINYGIHQVLINEKA